VHQQIVSEPFVTLGAEGKFDVIARIVGGGVTGQAGALRLGLARALTLVDPESRPPLKKAGFLTRDARVKERKKYGLKKARNAPQYSKRYPVAGTRHTDMGRNFGTDGVRGAAGWPETIRLAMR